MTAAISSNPVMKKMNERIMNNTVLLRRTGKADEIANTALFLLSDESSYITGPTSSSTGAGPPAPSTSSTSARTT